MAHSLKGIQGIWAAALAGAVILTVCSDATLAHWADAMRARNPNTYLKKGQDFYAADDLASALEQVNQALAINPSLPDPYILRGHVYTKMKDWEQAAACFRRGLDLGHPDQRIRVNLLWCLIELGRQDEALTFAAQSIALGVTLPELYRTAAVAFVRAGRLRDAVPYLEKALEANPDDAYVLTQLSDAYRLRGETAKAEAMTRRAEEAPVAARAAEAAP